MKLCGSEPTLQQLAEQLDEPIENVALAIQAAQPAMSLTPEGEATPLTTDPAVINRLGAFSPDGRRLAFASNARANVPFDVWTLDLDDPYYDEENSWCEEQDPLLKQALEKCCIAMAESPIRSDLEALYFGEGAFEFYDKFKIYSNDEVQQVNERFNRAGQTRKMTIVRLGASALEWNIYAAVEGKRLNQETILDMYKRELSLV